MKTRMAAAVFALFLVSSLSPEISAAQRDVPRSRSDVRALDLASFDLVWKAVKETYHDSTLGGLDWQGMRDRLRPRMEAAATREEGRSVIEELIAPLNQSHFMIIPREYYQGERTDSALSRYGVCGFDIRLVDGKVLVTSVRDSTPAFAAGVRPGWEVVRIDGVPVRETIDEISALYKGRTRFEFELIHTLYSSLGGEIGDKGKVLFRDGKSRKRELAIVLAKRPGRYIPAYGNLGPAFVDFEAKKLAGEIGYIRFNGFAGVAYLSSSFNGAMDTLRSAKGVVIDLRGNSGGIGGIALAMAGWFVGEKGRSLATIASRDRADKLFVTPRAKTYDGPLAVLVDGLTASAAEFLSGGLQDLGCARLFGSRTAGFSGRGDLLKLPNGDMFMHMTAQHVRANGTDVEGNGIEPDVSTPPTRESLLAGKDAALEAALEWLRGCGEKTGFQERRGPYLGQAPPGTEPALFAPGIVSTGFYERDLAVSPDGKKIFYGLVFGKHVTIMHTRLMNGAWTEPEIAPFARDLAYYYFEPAMSSDGKRLYFLCTRPPAGQEPKPGWAHQNIWAVDRLNDGSWGDPHIIGAPVSTDDEEYFPSVTRDGTMYFTRQKKGEEKSDIYRARLVNGAYEEAEMLPAAVNGTGNVYNACIAPDESFLVACVTGRDDSITKGLPHYYVFFRNPDDTWSDGINLGEKINFPGAQALSPSISSDGKYFFFASTRSVEIDATAPGALTARGIKEFYGRAQNGLADIYWIDASFIQSLRRNGKLTN
jgi:carboxyl-terminal processing protease